MKEKMNGKKFLTDYLPAIATFVGIVVCGIIYKQQFIKLLPVCISLIIGMFTIKANRIAFLIGAANCFVYIVGYASERLYGSVLSTLFSAIIQFSSFLLWKKRAYKQATEFRALKNGARVGLYLGVIIVWAITSFVLYKTGANAVVLDGLIFVLGFVVPIMQMFALIDAVPLHILSAVVNIVMWCQIVFAGNFANLTYLINGPYTLAVVIRAGVKWFELYKEQQAKRRENEGI